MTVPLHQDKVTVQDEVILHTGVCHRVRAVRLAVHLGQGVQVLITAASMDDLLVLAVQHLLGMFYHVGLLAHGVHLLTNQKM